LSSFAAGGGSAFVVAFAVACAFVLPLLVLFSCHPSPQAEDLLLPLLLQLLLHLSEPQSREIRSAI
jgi:hypothetical protein